MNIRRQKHIHFESKILISALSYMESDKNRNNFENHIISSYILYNISTIIHYISLSKNHPHTIIWLPCLFMSC